MCVFCEGGGGGAPDVLSRREQQYLYTFEFLPDYPQGVPENIMTVMFWNLRVAGVVVGGRGTDTFWNLRMAGVEEGGGTPTSRRHNAGILNKSLNHVYNTVLFLILGKEDRKLYGYVGGGGLEGLGGRGLKNNIRIKKCFHDFDTIRVDALKQNLGPCFCSL